CGHRSAGHFVKMVHNGIEYAEMQHLSEAMLLLRRGLGLEAEAVADLMSEWNEGRLGSFLVEITAEILRTPDPESPDTPIVDAILDRAGQKGTGRWTAQAALELAVATPSITAAVDARVLSAQLELRKRAENLLDGESREPLEDITPSDVHAALLAGRILTWSQGFSLLATASDAFDYETPLPEIARIWKGGCIIRARLLDDACPALESDSPIPLVFDEPFRGMLRETRTACRRLVAAAARSGIATPGLAASLGWLETLATARGGASLIQAQRDRFGSHRFERVDDPGRLVHHDWSRSP
ncbi:MAG: NADP(+)-dependent, decarboxylating phosphogluconate dehydrogenase, partial [bacterium]